MSASSQVLELSRKKPTVKNTQNVADELFELQLEQLKHDEVYHKDICLLNVHHRINHMALHFAKYTGQLVEISSSENSPSRDEFLNQTITDTFVISLILGNILNKKISESIKEINIENFDSLLELGTSLSEAKLNDENHLIQFLHSLAIGNGKIARACEKLDHMEGFPFREEVYTGLTEIFKSTLTIASQINLDLSKTIRERWIEIEKRSVFYETL